MVYEKQQKFDDAVREFRSVIALDPKHAEAYNYVGYMFVERGQNLDEAIDLINKALALEPENGYFLDSLGWAFYQQGKFPDALRELKRAVDKAKEDPVIFEHLGDAYLKNGFDEDAATAWEKALQLDPPPTASRRSWTTCGRRCGGCKVNARRLRSSVLALLVAWLAVGCAIAMPRLDRRSVRSPPRGGSALHPLARVHRLPRPGRYQRGSAATSGSGSTASSWQGSGQRPLRGPVALRPANPDRRRPRGQAHRLQRADERGGRGRRHGGDHRAVLGLPFEPEDLAAVVAGYAVPPRDLRMAELLPADAKGPSISMVGSVHEQRVWMDFQTGVVSQLKIIGGRADATVTYERDPDGQVTGFDVTAASRWVNGTVRYKNIAVGVGLRPNASR